MSPTITLLELKGPFELQSATDSIKIDQQIIFWTYKLQHYITLIHIITHIEVRNIEYILTH